MDIGQAAKHLDVSIKTIRRLVARGDLRAQRITIPTGSRLEFEVEDLEAYSRKTVHPEVVDKAMDNTQARGGQGPEVDTSGPQELDISEDVHRSSLPVSTVQTGAVFEEMAKAIVRALDTTGPPVAGAGVSIAGQIENLPDLLTVAPVAEYLQVGKSKVLSLLKAGQLRGIKGMGRGWKVKKEDLRKFVEGL